MAEWPLRVWNEMFSCTSCNCNNDDGETSRMRIKMPAEPMRSVSRTRVHLVIHHACVRSPGLYGSPAPRLTECECTQFSSYP